jgi:5S rRNA maturation endonuclease (ribonuclease M5)
VTDTPETDAAVIAAGGDWSPVLRAVAQRLERERNGARELAEAFHRDQVALLLERDEANEELHKQLVRYDELFAEAEQIRIERYEARQAFVIATDQMVIAQSNLREANKERDETREELHDIRLNLGADAEGYTLLHAVCVIQNERDEAREALMEIESVFVDGCDTCSDRERMGTIARAALAFHTTLQKVK